MHLRLQDTKMDRDFHFECLREIYKNNVPQGKIRRYMHISPSTAQNKFKLSRSLEGFQSVKGTLICNR